jgi:hypothetical protein
MIRLCRWSDWKALAVGDWLSGCFDATLANQ